MSESKFEGLVIPAPDQLAGAAIEAKCEAVAVNKAKMENARCFALAVMAGIMISMGALFMALVRCDATLGFAVSQVFGAAMFSLGLVCVLVAGAELFTGNSLMICAKASGKITWGQMFKNWGIVYAGNLMGSLLIVFVIHMCNMYGMNGGALGSYMVTVAAAKIAPDWVVLLFRGIMCNLLVCLAVWMGFAGKTVIDKIFVAIFPVTAFVGMGFEHSIANMFFLPMGLVAKCFGGFEYAGAANADLVNLGGILYNISAVTIGNVIGGCVFVGLIYWFAYRKK